MTRLMFAAAMLALALPAAARAEWREATSKHFIIYSEGSEAELRRHAERLEALHWLMLAANGVQDEVKPYRVKVYFTRPDAVKRLAGAKNSDIAGFYRPLPAGPIAVVPRGSGEWSEVVLYHEYGHHFMRQYFPKAYPAWYVEGWAELVSTASFEAKGKVSYGKAANHRQYDLELGRNIPIRELLTKSYGTIDAAFRARFYGQSWLLTHYLTFSEERKGQLRAYLSAINAGADFEQAAAAFGDLDALQRDLGRYLGARNFRYRQPALPADLATGVAIRTLGGAEAALIGEALDFTREMPEAEAKAFLAKLRTKVAAHPKDAYALQLLAEAEYDAEEYDAAARTADALLAVAHERPRALYWKGMIELARANPVEGEKRKPAFVAARMFIVKARAADRDDPLPHIAYFQSFAMEGQRPPKAAIDGLATAVSIVPQDDGARLTLASWLIAQGQGPRAAALLKPVAFDPHGGGSAQAAKDMLAKLGGGADKGEAETE